MRFKTWSISGTGLLISAALVFHPSAQTTINSNKSGKQGEYHYEYWKDNGTGTMTLGDGCNFSCQWGQVNNILFRKGVRPGSRNEVVTYSADYKPQGNSYLSIYGWFKNPLVEYYIIESWGTWKPPGAASKGTFETDSGTYDIYQNSRTGPSIEGDKTFQQYWSVRKTKRTSGVITCKNHFAAWEAKGMKIGSFYEVSFNVEAYQSSGGSADVKVVMDTVPSVGVTGRSGAGMSSMGKGELFGRCGSGHFPVTAGGAQTISFRLTAERYAVLRVYNSMGRQVAMVPARKYSAGNNMVTFDVPNIASGVYQYFLQERD